MGSLSKMMSMIPGLNQLSGQIDEEQMDGNMKKSEAIILSMTLEERRNPSIIKSSRKNRIAKGSGVQVSDVNRLLSQYEKTQRAMKQMAALNRGGKMPQMPGVPKMAGMGGITPPAATNQKKFVSKLKKKRR